MRRALSVFLIGSVMGLVSSCGGHTSVHGLFPPGSTIVTTSGFVSTVQFTSVPDHSGKFVDATIITLVQPEFDFFNQTAFCGDAVRFFPFDSFVEVRFVPANPCVVTFTVDVFN